MIGVWPEHAKTFILVLALATTAFFVIPIFFAPLRWARLMLWKIPEQTDLAIYFGRCLGAFGLILEIFMFRAGLTGAGLNLVFEFMILLWAFMAVVHVAGAIQHIQPITETLEIGFWAVLIVLTVAFWPVAGPLG